MLRKHNKKLTPIAKKLRKEMTKQEKHLWYDFLRTYRPRFLRQKAVNKFVADFYCSKAKLIIELDGSQHYTEKGLLKDKKRTKILNTYGLKIIRFTNNEIDKHFEGVCMRIDTEVKQNLGEVQQ